MSYCIDLDGMIYHISVVLTPAASPYTAPPLVVRWTDLLNETRFLLLEKGSINPKDER